MNRASVVFARLFFAASIGASSLFACSTDDGRSGNTPPVDAGSTGDGSVGDGGGCLQGFAAPPGDPGSGAILFTASGEVLALGGYDFPPATPDDVAFVDGWEMRFTRLIVTVDKIRISENPDKVPTDQSQTDGLVAEVDGPWAIDLHKGGALAGKGGAGEQAVAIASVANQNKSGGAAFDPTKRYAFGFDTIAATCGAQNVNLDADGLADYQDMIKNGWAVLYVGTATFRGGTTCTTPSTTYDFTKLPPVVNFKLGFASPTTYGNCQNPDNDPAAPFANEEHQRGVQTKTGTFVVAQVTIHTDHPFWESIVHDSPAHFDPIAARFVGVDAGTPTATLDDVAGVDFTSFQDKAGVNLPWRSCVATYTAKMGTMSFDPQSVPVNPSAQPSAALRDYRDFMTYDQSTQGHLNSDGLCFVSRNYPSPH
jgi:hypothetical protein